VPIAAAPLASILLSTLWIGVTSALVLFVFAPRIRQALQARPPAG
jgi:hypothetical protein